MGSGKMNEEVEYRDFECDLKDGQKWEDKMIPLLKKLWFVENIDGQTFQMDMQKIGIDSSMTLRPVTLDLKTRAYKYYCNQQFNQDILIETISNREYNSIGWFYKTKSDFIVNVWKNGVGTSLMKDAYFIRIQDKEFRDWFENHKSDFKKCIAGTIRKNSYGEIIGKWTTESRLVKVKDFPPGILQHFIPIVSIVNQPTLLDFISNGTNKRIFKPEVENQFIDGIRYYIVDGLKLPSVTSILKSLPTDERLLSWQENTPNYKEITSVRSNFGTILHFRIEDYYAKKFDLVPVQLELSSIPTEEMRVELEKVDIAYSYFLDFNTQYNPKVLNQEFVILAKTMGYAGRGDIYCEMDGYRWLVDLKSSSRIYPSHIAQTSAYAHGMDEMGMSVDKIGILRCNEQGWEFRDITEHEADGWQMFNNALCLFYGKKDD